MKNMNLFGALAALVVSGSAVAESARIELKWEEGKTYHTRQNMDMVMDMGAVKSVTSMTMEMKGKVAAHEKGVGVATSIDSVKTKTEAAGQTFSYDSTKEEGNSPHLVAEMEKVMKMQFTAVYDKTGKFVKVEDIPAELQNVQGMDKKTLEANLRQQSVLLPNKEVNVGETWKAKVASPIPGMGKDLNMTFDVKFDRLVKEGGRKIAKLSFTGVMEKTEVVEQGQKMTIEAKGLSGTIDFDVNLGQIYKSVLNTNLSVTAQGGIAIQMDMDVATELYKVE